MPVLRRADGDWVASRRRRTSTRTATASSRYRPRIEGLFARIERWTNLADPATCYWRSISRTTSPPCTARTAESRIADPADPGRIFSWLICESYDDKGNVIVYDYKPEDGARRRSHVRPTSATAAIATTRGVRRTATSSASATATARRCSTPAGNGRVCSTAAQLERRRLDVRGRLRLRRARSGDAPPPNDAGAWRLPPRPVLLLPRRLRGPHLPALPARADVPPLPRRAGRRRRLPGPLDRLRLRQHEKAATDVRPRLQLPARRSPRRGYRRRGRRLPQAQRCRRSSSTTRQAIVQDDGAATSTPRAWRTCPSGSTAPPTSGSTSTAKGIPGVLTEQAGAWFYKRNLSPVSAPAGRIRAARQRVAAQAQPARWLAGSAQFIDLAGDGRPTWSLLDGPTPGPLRARRRRGLGAVPPVPRAPQPRLARPEPAVRRPERRRPRRRADHRGRRLRLAPVARRGRLRPGPARPASRSDEERGPALVFADGDAVDLPRRHRGDGLTDLVRIRNGEVCYWPNLGYGRFGAKVTMDDAPLLRPPGPVRPAAHPARRHRRLGHRPTSSTCAADGVRLYFNQSGNGWSAARDAARLPARRTTLASRHGRRPARQRDRLPGLVVAAARRRTAPAALSST